MASQGHLVRVQEKGQITLPAAVRQRFKLQKGDLVAIECTESGVLVRPQALIALEALDRIGAVLREQGVTLEELMESGREIRAELVKEQYGLGTGAADG